MQNKYEQICHQKTKQSPFSALGTIISIHQQRWRTLNWRLGLQYVPSAILTCTCGKQKEKQKNPEEAARQLITYPVVVGKSHLPFLPQLPSVMERSHSSGYILSFVMKHVG